MDNRDEEVLLKVDHLCQYFSMGHGNELKAVDDVSFEVKKGEVFGLVGESGCGKTTTGRSIIRLYDITSGSVYFKGERICAGTRSYVEKIKELKKSLREEKDEEKKNIIRKEIASQKKLIKEAKDDHKNCERKYFKKLKAEYEEEINKVGGKYESLSEENQTKFKVIQNYPKIPKLFWMISYILCYLLAATMFIAGIVNNVVFNKKYENYKRASSIVTAIDSENKTTTVMYEITYENEKKTYTATINYYDPDLELSDDVKVRLNIYYDETDPSNASKLLTEKPVSQTAPVFFGIALLSVMAAVVMHIYCHERYNPARLVTQIQMIFQDPIASLNPRMTVKDIISEGLVIAGEKDKKYIDEQVYKVLELVGLVPEHAGRYPHEFSGGQRQRIGVARSIIMQPELIIADEPISALDVSIQAQVINLLNELRDRLGLTILFIAHDLSVVKYFSDRIGVMYFGQMVELASSDELFAHPLHPYTKSLLSAIPLPDPHYEKRRRRFVYNPLAEHDYSVDKPSMREVSPGHFVMCNEAEFNKYVEEIKGISE